MKFITILILAIAFCHAAPVEDEQATAAKAKRGLHLGIGYHHAPSYVSHSYVAPAVVHHAPIISHAPIIAHAPLIAHHAPLYSAHHILPSYHSYHHYK